MFENWAYRKAKAMLKNRENIDVPKNADWSDVLYSIGLYFGAEEADELKNEYIREDVGQAA